MINEYFLKVQLYISAIKIILLPARTLIKACHPMRLGKDFLISRQQTYPLCSIIYREISSVNLISKQYILCYDAIRHSHYFYYREYCDLL